MSSRQGPKAATKKIVPALVLLAASGLSLSAQAQDGAASSAPATAAILDSLTATTVPALTPSPVEPQPADNGAVFDAPNMPGVRMMAPIPDKLEPSAERGPGEVVPGGAAVTRPRGERASPVPASVVAPPPAPSAKAAAARGVPANKAKLIQAFAATHKGDWSAAQRLADEARSPATGSVIEWLRLLDTGATSGFDDINAFLKQHRNWPREETLLANAEKSMPDDLTYKSVVEWYGTRAPITAIGMIRLGEAEIGLGELNKGIELIRRAWIQGSFTASDEATILSAHSDLLSQDTHRARLDQLLAHDDLNAARRQIARVDDGYARIANARIRVKASPALAKTVLDSLPPELQGNSGLLYDAAHALRQRGLNEDAATTLVRASADRSFSSAPEQWWNERNILAREALKAGRYDLAYDLVSKHVQDNGTSLYEAEFMAGWIALRFLHKPEVALEHFKALAKSVSMPISVARAYYWLGRTEEELKHPLYAIGQYRRAATNAETFYGQLALARIEDSPTLRLQTVSHEASRDDELAFEADERVQAIRVLNLIGDRYLMRQFAIRMANDRDNPKRTQLLAQMMVSLGDAAMGVRVAKIASYNDIIILSSLAPVVPLPKFPGPMAGPEPALVLGLTRQESEFDAGAVSTAGARGLMQLMPATAKKVASTHRMTYNVKNLTADPKYNMQLGMATLEEYLEYWGGSYILGIATYNAGPGNVVKWVEANGDPRDPTVDPVDWIEMIPYGETRNYVQRVLENIQLYRNRLSGNEQKLTILSDLYRPKLPSVIVVKYQPPAPEDVPIPVPKPTQASVLQ